MSINIEELKSHLDDYLYEVTTVSDGKIKECPICKSGSGQHKTCAFSIWECIIKCVSRKTYAL